MGCLDVSLHSQRGLILDALQASRSDESCLHMLNARLQECARKDAAARQKPGIADTCSPVAADAEHAVPTRTHSTPPTPPLSSEWASHYSTLNRAGGRNQPQ